MPRSSISPITLLLLAGTTVMGGCTPRPPAPMPTPVIAPANDRKAELAAILASLDRGDLADASPRIDALLARNPHDAQLRVLRASIDSDPVALLGPSSFAYTVRPGETMTGLAVRFLGTPLKAYQLARYNGIAVPASLAAGTVLRIPGEAPRAAKPRTPTRPRVTVHPSPLVAPPVAAPVSTPVKSDPVAAKRARAAGLAALAQGNIDGAVAALRRAASLDPGDPLIRRDLARAERVAATVKARR